MQNKLKSGIYCIENIETNKKYIGQAVDIQDRWRRHIGDLNRNAHCNDYLQNAWNKYGKDGFKFYIIESCDVEQLDEKEIYYIDFYNTMDRNYGYNMKSGGQLSSNKYSDEVKQKMSQSVKASYENSNLRDIRKKNAINQWSNIEIKQKIMGVNNGMYGKQHTEEAKQKMSAKKKGKQSWRRNTTPVFCIELNKQFNDATEAGNELSIDGSAILKVCRGERKTCGGYHWEFLNILENNIS